MKSTSSISADFVYGRKGSTFARILQCDQDLKEVLVF